MVKNPTLAVVLHWGDAESTKNCLRSLEKNQSIDILVVNNTGRSLGLGYQEVVNETNLGFAGGMNIGLRHSIENGYEKTLILNNDTLVDSNLVSKLSEALDANEDMSAVAPTITYLNQPDKIWFSGGSFSKLSGRSPHSRLDEDVAALPKDAQVEAVSFLTGCCVLFKNEALVDIGLFDEDYFLYWEDDDWCVRSTAKGWTLGHLPIPLVRHEVSLGTGSASPDYLYYNARNHFLFAWKNFSRLKRLPILVFALGLGIAASLRRLLKGSWRGSKAINSAIYDGLRRKTGKR